MKKIILGIMMIMVLFVAGCGGSEPAEDVVPATPLEPAQEVEEPMVGNDKDEHGCIGSAGYEWCEAKQKCLRPFEEDCEEPEPEVVEEPEPVVESYQMSKEQQDGIGEKLTKGTQSTFLTSAYPKGLKVGESYVFAYGITNHEIIEDTKEYRFSIHFKEARDKFSNPIEIAEEKVLAWFANNEFPQPTLGKNEQVTFAVGVMPDSNAKPGTYYVEILTEQNDGYAWKESFRDDFNFRVLE